jgi:hypothetical protein
VFRLLPSHAWVACNRAANVSQEVCFGASWSDRRAEDFLRDDIEVDRQQQSAVADVVELAPLHLGPVAAASLLRPAVLMVRCPAAIRAGAS